MVDKAAIHPAIVEWGLYRQPLRRGQKARRLVAWIEKDAGFWIARFADVYYQSQVRSLLEKRIMPGRVYTLPEQHKTPAQAMAAVSESHYMQNPVDLVLFERSPGWQGLYAGKLAHQPSENCKGESPLFGL